MNGTRKFFSILTALSLCLSLLPGTALAQGSGTVTITGTDPAKPVALGAGKYYVINEESGGGVTAQDSAPGSGDYLTYADGVMTVHGAGETGLYGQLALAGDLTIKYAGGEQKNFFLQSEDSSSPTLALSGHTLTLEDGIGLMVAKGEGASCPPVDGGTILFANKLYNNAIFINSWGNAASGALTVENAGFVSIEGSTESSPVIDNLTVRNCDRVEVYQYSETNTGLSNIVGSITTDRPVLLGVAGAGSGGTIAGVKTPDGEIWAYGGPIEGIKNSNNMYIINAAEPIVYDAGDGKVFYEPAAEGSSTILTLDGASFDETIYIQSGSDQTDNPLRLELKGGNQMKITAKAPLTLTGTGSFTGKLQVGGFTNNSTGTLNAVVGVMMEADSRYSYTVYGKRSTSDFPFNVSTSVPLTIAEGATLTVDTADGLTINDLAGLTNNGTIINNAGIKITADENAADTDISAFIRGLKLTGTGNVSVKKGTGTGGDADTYTNSGLKLLDPAGTNGKLDLSNATSDDTTNWNSQGYKWENVEKDADSKITSAKLTLAPGFNATSVTLPDATVTIETTGESRIDELVGYDINGSGPQKTELTFSGTSPLTVDKRMNIAGGAGNTITVAEGAQVTANNGIYVGATGKSSVTVNGTLKATGYHDDQYNSNVPAVTAGKVEVSNTGVLEVSGGAGVLLNGMSGDFTNLFTVTGDGRFTADCSEYNILVAATNADVYPKGDDGQVDASKVIVLGDEYMPDNCELRLVGNDIKLWDTKKSKEFTGPLTIHKNHTWETTWTQGETTHWHACEFAGCTEKQPGSEAAHFYRSCTCTVCSYQAPAGTPDSDSGSSGGDSGGSSGGGSHETTYTVTVEKAEHGKVVSDRRTASRGRTVTLTVSPDEGYETGTIAVTDRSGKALDVTDKGGGTYTFIMPGGNVSVRAVFNKIAADYEACARDSSCPIWPFTDADANAWYHDGVHYCLGNGLMSGYGDYLFGPNAPLSRAQFAQILHNREGRPAVNYLMQFVDVSGKEWYAEAVHWAASEGVVEGYGDGRFGPGDNITREQLAVMLWRYAGSPAAADGTLAFTDADAVSEYAREALCWAVENGILQGKDGGVLDPQGQATRAEAAAMLMRYLSK